MVSAVGVVGFHALLGYALISGLGVSVIRQTSDNLKAFDVLDAPVTPPPKPAPDIAEAPNPEAAASPANLTAMPSPVVLPPPVIALSLPPPVVAAPVAAMGTLASAGASDVPGSGTGSGGQGAGAGSGGTGTGSGGGGVAVPAYRIKGRIRDRDYPRAAYEAHASGTVFMRLAVGADGRVSDCSIDESSGRADMDAVTCRLVMERFRYRPAEDSQGRKVADIVHMAWVWETAKR